MSLIDLKKKRTVIKSKCTRVSNSFPEGMTPITRATISAARAQQKKLDTFWNEYDDVQSQIELLEDGEEDRANFEKAYYEIDARLDDIINSPSAPGSPSTQSVRSPSDAGGNGSNIKLPQLNLPTFSGKYNEWCTFADLFQSAIDNNAALSDSQRFQYLKTSLSGPAADLVRPLEISDHNYAVAWGMLKERYENRRRVVYAHLRALFESAPVTRENALELRQLCDGFSMHIQSLSTLKKPIDWREDLMVYLLVSKLDARTSRAWKNSLIDNELPTLKSLTDFISRRCAALEDTDKAPTAPMPPTVRNNRNNRRVTSANVATVGVKCAFCNGSHYINKCANFTNLAYEKRLEEAHRRKICINCLRSKSHRAEQCTASLCKRCGGKHNTLLHPYQRTSDQSAYSPPGGESENSAAVVVAHTHSSRSNAYIMLSTALVHVCDSNGTAKQCRALLDCGSQSNFITRDFVKSLQLESRPCNVTIAGFGNNTTAGTRRVQITLKSRLNAFTASIDCLVVDKITDNLPSTTVKRSAMTIPRNIKLADPFFHSTKSVDLLIGAGLFWELLCVGQIKASPQNPVLQKTKFGWIVAGPLSGQNESFNVKNLCVTVDESSLQSRLAKFWELESINARAQSLSPQERKCERHFAENVSRNAEGRIRVRLPVKEDRLLSLGDSRKSAMRRFVNLEKRLSRSPDLKLQYSQFMREYESLNHMKRIDERDDAPGIVNYYLPHHAVMREASQTTKLRVVFDASCKSTSGLSLNDLLLVGPVVQQDLTSIMLRFRMHAYVLIADITKMYRQILIDEDQRKLQRILWRDDSSQPISTYELLTVTYGTASASFLATRCLNYLAFENARDYPIGSQIVSRDFYVDDMLTGADTVAELQTIRDEVIALLAKGKLTLNKWASNNAETLKGVHHQNSDSSHVIFAKDDSHRILGVRWSAVSDEYYFHVEAPETSDRVTKRNILSEISQLFDPIGFLSPVIVTAKIIIQKLWELNLDWDASVPCDVHTRWEEFKTQLTHLNEVRIPRCVKFSTDPRNLQIHGFCDASEMAYGACIYVRSRLTDDEYRVELLCAKSRVAPLRAVSLPRLELCAALLLAELHDKVRSAIGSDELSEYFWSDSTIALNWITSSSRRWSTFVANRVGEIQRLTRMSRWKHVRTEFNPADIVSRGATPDTLLNSSLWWRGPEWLRANENLWPETTIPIAEDGLPEEKQVVRVALTTSCDPLDRLLNKTSNFSKLARVVAYSLRFARNARANGVRGNEEAKNAGSQLSPEENSRAIEALCRYVQAKEFPKEMRALQQSRAIETSSKLLSLSPFLDSEGTIRVGGRLKNSNEGYEVRHPILLPKGSRLTQLIIDHEHARNMHAGTQATMASIRRRFWPLSLRSEARKRLRQCVICFKARPRVSEAIMGQLPIARVTPSRPFSHTGVDYGGPFMIRDGKRRNSRSIKAYIAIFICLSVKAIHIELVGDLTTESFLGALKRFISRRGKAHTIYSDNGTNFVGAARELKELHDLFKQEQVRASISEFCLDSGINWHFIPPNAPHFGGLWEAGIKSAKYHMLRIIGKASLTFEEMQTALCEIESILNSRPVTPLSNDPNDLSCLTPGHFLVGEALNSFPQANLRNIAENRLSRWQRVEQLRQHFWQRWQREYLSQLHERRKWKRDKGEQLEPGRIVMVHQQGLPPLHWLLGRIQKIHAGSDGVARSATIKTSKGIIDRPLSKLSILPLEE